jgi:hypothetical protein
VSGNTPASRLASLHTIDVDQLYLVWIKQCYTNILAIVITLAAQVLLISSFLFLSPTQVHYNTLEPFIRCMTSSGCISELTHLAVLRIDHLRICSLSSLE